MWSPAQLDKRYVLSILTATCLSLKHSRVYIYAKRPILNPFTSMLSISSVCCMCVCGLGGGGLSRFPDLIPILFVCKPLLCHFPPYDRENGTRSSKIIVKDQECE